MSLGRCGPPALYCSTSMTRNAYRTNRIEKRQGKTKERQNATFQYATVVDKRLWIYVFGHLNQTEIQTKTKTKTQAGEPARGARSAPA